MIQLRGHHIFCLLGFQGMGYSKEYADNMKKMHRLLRNKPNTLVRIINGADDLCAKFPCDAPYHCDAVRVDEQDRAFLEILRLHIGDVLTWREIEQRLQQFATPAMIETVCFDCQWRAYGLCEQGVARVKRGEGLMLLEE